MLVYQRVYPTFPHCNRWKCCECHEFRAAVVPRLLSRSAYISHRTPSGSNRPSLFGDHHPLPLQRKTPYKEPLVWDLIIFDHIRSIQGTGKDVVHEFWKHLKTRFQNSSRGCLETKRPATSRHSAVTLPGFGKGIRDDRDVEASWHNSPGTCFFPTLKGLNSCEPSKLEDI